ncbi:MAG TPA: Arc family DNA-binding protein [Rhizomicrobium sp.]|jgi:plasmid stability protein
MGQLLVRDVPEETIAALKERAKENGRSAEAEHRALLQQALKPQIAEQWKEIDRLRNELAESGRTFADSTEFIRRDRDSR